MKNILSSFEFDAQIEASRQHAEMFQNWNGFDSIGKNWNRFSQEYFWEIKLRTGLYLAFDDNDFHVAVSKEMIHDESMTLLAAKFYLSGRQGVFTEGIREIPTEYEERAGQHYLWFLPNLREVEVSPAYQRSQVLKIYLDLDLFREFSQGFELLPIELKLVLGDDRAPRFHRSIGRITPPMYSAIEQILHCPYQGLTKRMFLEAKALELIALQIAQWLAVEHQTESTQIWSNDDLERLHHARSIVLDNLTAPLSLFELARQVGLNDFKLKKGFKDVFGTTVFECLQAQRMELAKQLLAQRQQSMAEIAHQVGYASQSHFSHMFKQQFGITPKSYRQSQRNGLIS